MKKKIWKTVLWTWILALAFSGAVPAWAAVNRLSVPPSGWQLNTPAENLFRLSGSDKEFVLLETAGGETPKFFILAKDVYGSRAFDPDNTTKFDPGDTNNIAYWLNHDFLDPAKPGMKLPAEIVPHIDMNHIWQTEGCHPSSTCPEDYSVKAGVALLSQTEYAAYAPKFGVKDAITGTWGWWLRTARGVGITSPNFVMGLPLTDSALYGQTHANPANWGGASVRPAFYLNPGFFSSVKLDVASMGSNVKKALVANYTKDQLQGSGTPNYSDGELEQIGFSAQIRMTLSDFEAGMNGWSLYLDGAAGGSIARSSEQYHDGSASAAFTSDFTAGGTYTMIHKNLTPLDIRSLEFWVKTEDYSSFHIRMVDFTGETHQQEIVLQNTPDWQRVSLSAFTALTAWGGDQNKVYNGPAIGISIVTQKNRLKSGLTGGTLWMDGMKADIGNDIVENGGFETAVWPEKTANAVPDTATHHSGNQSLKISGNGTAEQYAAALYSVEPTKGYELAFWAKGALNASAGVKISVLELDGQGNKVTSQPRTLMTTGVTTEWTRYSVYLGNFSPSTAFAKIYAGLEKTSTAQVFFDDVAIQPANESVSFRINAPGSILDPQTAQFQVSFATDSSMKPTVYTIEYNVPGSGVAYTPVLTEVLPGQIKQQEVPLTGLKNGIHRLEVRVKYGERPVKSFSQTFSVMPSYQSQGDDKYSIAGISSHYALENRQGPTDTEIIAKSGIRFIRDELSWHKVEKQPGVFDFTRHDSWVQDVVSKGIEIIGVLDFSNTLYNGMSGVPEGIKYGPKNKEELDAYINYVYQTVLHYKGKINTYELWNEPNIVAFWKPEPNVIDYSNLVKAASAAIRRANPDAVIIAGAVANQKGYEFLNRMFDQGVYPYIDAISFHPYVYPYNPDLDYADKLKYYGDTIRTYGGWKDLYVTEVGWPTAVDIRGIDEQHQAEYLMKHFMISAAGGIMKSAIYDFRDDGTDPHYTEDNFGIIHNDYTAKPSLIAIRQLNGAVAGASFWAEAELGPGLKGYLWMRNREPVLVMWSVTGEQTYDFLGESVAAADLYGNPVASGSHQVAVGSEPVYITNLSTEWVVKQAAGDLAERYGRWLEDWGAKLSGAPQVSDQVNKLKNAAEEIGESGRVPSFESLTGTMDLHYAQGEALIGLVQENKTDRADTMTMLYDLFAAGTDWEHLLSLAGELPPMSGPLSSTGIIAEAAERIQSRVQAASGGSLPFAGEILRHAKRWNVRAEESRLQEQTGNAAAWDHTAARLAGWSEAWAAFEPVEHQELLVQVIPSRLQMFEGETVSFRMAVTNGRSDPFHGELTAVDKNGVELISPMEIVLQPHESKSVDAAVAQMPAGTTDFFVQLKENGAVVRTQNVPVTLNKKVEVSLLPAADTLSSLKQVRFKVKNLMPANISGFLNVQAPDGWLLQQPDQAFSIPAGSEQVISFEVLKSRSVPFHQYVFHITAADGHGGTINEKSLPLPFTVIPKAKAGTDPFNLPEDPAGAWRNAYPVYLNPPAVPDSEAEWENSNAAAKVYAQWDEDYMYFLVQAYDDIHNNTKHDAAIWNGDSVQISLDARNDKTSSYNADDYEYGFALSGDSRQAYAWKAAAGNQPGAKPPEWMKAVRSEGDRLTSYQIRIPKAELEPLTLSALSELGLNIALNDADILDRERFIELTPGTASSKNPSFYHTWKLADREQEDLTAPVITWHGVSDGGSYTDAAAPSVQAEDPDSGVDTVIVHLDGQPWVAGTPVTQAGPHTLTATAADFAGNTVVETVHFTIYTSTSLTVRNASGQFSDEVRLEAQLKDREGQPVPGALLAFAAGGFPAGTAQTNEQGIAALNDTIRLGAGVSEWKAVYSPNHEAYHRGSEASGSLAVSKEGASVLYTGSQASEENAGAELAARIMQEQDGSLGPATGLPVQFLLSEVNPDGTLTPLSISVTQNVYRTDVNGSVSAAVSLPAGLYEVRTKLMENDYLEASEAVSYLAVNDPASGTLMLDGFISLSEGSPLVGDHARKIQINMTGNFGDKAHGTSRLRIHAEPQGIDLALDSLDWAAVADTRAYLQGTAGYRNETYTVRLMVQDAGRAEGGARISLLIWKGTDVNAEPAFQVLAADWSGICRIKP